MIWFLRDKGIYLRYEPKFGSGGGIGTTFEGGRGEGEGYGRV